MTIKKRILISLLIVLPVLAAIGAGIYFMLPKAPAITSINLKYEINLEHIYIDEPFNIQAEILPENANKSRLAWYSTNPAVATVDSDGKVTPVGMGFVTITAISLDDSSIKRSLSFYVKNLSRQLEMSPLSVEYDGEAHQTYVEGWQPTNGTLIYKFTGTLAGGESYTPNNETTRTAPTDAGVYRVSVEIEGTGESNYTTLTITPKPVSVSVTSFQKEYLDPSPEFTYGITGLVKEDSLSFQISGGNNENVRAEPYILSITADLLEFTLDGKTYKTSLSDASSKKYNYTVSNILEGNFAITQKTVRIKILPKTSTYGEPLVPLEFEIYDSNDTLLTDTRFYESILGQLRAIDGNGGYLSDYLTPPDAKTYTISTDDLSSHNLSIIQFENAQYTITKRVISVYPNAGEKFAGSLDPVLSYSVSSNSVNDGTVFNNILVREGANSAEGELVGLYNYHLIDHIISDGEEINSTAYQNYTLKLINNGHVFSILQNRIQIIPQTLYEPFNLSQSYAENTILTGSLAYTMFINGKRASNTGLNSNGIELINGDRFKVITKLQTEDSTLPPEDTYKIYNITAAQEEVNFQDNFTFSGNADINKYDITFGTERMFVQKIILTLTVNPTTKTYGDSDPTFTYSKTGFAGFDNAENSIESVTYSRSDSGSKAGNTVGDYPVNISSVSLNSDKGYYKPVFVAGILSIIPKSITLNTNDYTLPYGAPIPNFVYSFIDANNDGVPDITLPYGDTNSDVATGSLSKNLTGTSDGTPSGLSVSGNNVGVYDILDTMLVKNANYQINYTPKKYTITKREVTIMPINLNIVYGDTLPQLLYNLETDTSEYGYDLESPLNSLSGEIRLSKTPDVYTAPDLPLAAGTYYFDKHTLAIGGNFHLQFNASGSAFIVSPLPVTLSFITKNFTGTVPDSSEALTVFSSNHGGLVYGDSIASLSLNLLNEEESMLYKITVLNDPSNPAGNADIALENVNGDDVTQNYLISLNLAMNTVFERGIQSLSIGISATAKTGENTLSKPFDGGTPWTFGAEILNSPEIGLHLDPNSLSFKFLYPNGRLLSSAPINAGSYLATLDLLSLRILDADNNDVTSLYSPTVSQPVSVSITPIAPTLTSEHTLAPLTYGTPYSYDGSGRHKFVGSEISGSFNVSGNYYTTDNSSLPVGTYPVSVTFEPDMISDIEGGQFKNYTNTLLTLNLTINPFSINISNTAAFSYTWTGSHPTYTGSAYTNTISNLNSVLGAHASSLSTSYHYYGFTFNGDGSVSIKKDNDTSTIFLENFGQSSFTIENNTGNFVMEYSGNKKIIISVSGTTLIARYDDNGVIWNILNTYSGTAPRFAGFYISAATIAANDSNVTLGGKTSETFYSGYSIKKAAFSSFTPNNLEFEYMAALDLESCILTPNPSGTLITTLGYSKTGLSFTSDVPVDAGGYFVKLSANQANYYSSQTFEFEIIKADISAELISPTDFDYDGNTHQPNYNLVWGESDSISSLQIEELNASTIPQSVWDDNEDWALVTALNDYLTTPINSIKQAVMLKTFLTSSSLNITFGGTQNNGAVYSSIAAPSNAGSYFMKITVVSPNFTGGNNKLSDSRKRFYIDPQSAPNLGINFESTNVAKDSLSDHTELYEHIINNMINTTSICLTSAGNIKTHLNSVYNTGATLVEDRKFEVTYLYDDDNDLSTPLVTRTAWVYADLSILGGYPLTYTNGNSWYNAINSTIGTKSLVLTLNFLDGNTQKIELRNTISINRITLSQQHFTAPDGAEYDYINQNIWGQLSRTSSSPIPIITDFSPSGFSQNEALYHDPSLITIRYQYKQNGFTLTQAPRDIGEYTVVATITVPSTSYYIIDNSSLKYEYSFTIIASTIYNNISDETISVDFKNEAYDADDIYDILSLDYEILTRAGGTAYALTFGSNPSQAENGLTFRVLFNSQSAQNLTSVTVAGTYTVRLLLIGSFGDNITDATNLIINFNFIIEPLSLGETVNDVLSHISNEPPFEFTYDAEPDISLDETPYGNAIDELYDTLEIAYFTSNDDNDPLASRIDITNGKSIYADPTVSAPTIYFRIISSNDSISPSFAVPITLYKQNIAINNITVDGSYALNGTITEYYNNNAPVEADKSRFSVVGLPEASGDDFVVGYFVANQWTAEAPTGVGTYNLRISLDATWYKTPYNQYKYFTFVVETTNDVLASAISFDYSDFTNAKYLSDDPSLGDNGYLPISFYSPSNAAASAPTIYYEGEQLSGWWLFTLEDMNAFSSGPPSLNGLDFNNAIAYVRTQIDSAHELAYFNNLDASLQAYIIPAVFVCNNPNISAMTVFLEYTVNKKVVDLSNSTTTLEVDNIHLSGITGPANNMIYHYNDMDIGGDYSVDLGVVGEYILDGENGNNASISLGSFTITSNNVFNTFNSGNTLFTPLNPPVATFESKNYTGEIGVVFNLTKPSLANLFSDAELSRPFSNSGITGTTNQTALLNSLFGSSGVEVDPKTTILQSAAFSFEGNSSDLSFIAALTNSGTYTFEATFEETNYYETTSITVTYTIAPLIINPVLSSTLITDPATDSLTVSLTVINPPSVFGLTTPAPNVILSAATIQDTALTATINNNWQFVFDISGLSNGSYSINISAASGFDDEIVFGTSAENPITLPIPFIIDKNMDMNPDLGAVFFNESLSPDELLMQLSEFYGYGEGILASAVWLNNVNIDEDTSWTTNTDNHLKETNYILSPLSVAPLYYEYRKNFESADYNYFFNEYIVLATKNAAVETGGDPLTTEETQRLAELYNSLFVSKDFVTSWNLSDGIYFGFNGGTQSFGEDGSLRFENMPVELTFNSGGLVEIKVSFTLYFDFELRYNNPSPFIYTGDAQGPTDSNFEVYTKGFLYTKTTSTSDFEPIDSLTTAIPLVSYSPTNHTNAGSYSATATYTPDNGCPKTYSFTVPFVIEKQPLSVTMPSKTVLYSGEELDLTDWATANVDGDASNAFIYYHGNSTNIPKNAGTYTIKAEWNGNPNYIGTAYATLIILPVTPTITLNTADIENPEVLINGVEYNRTQMLWASVKYYDSSDMSLIYDSTNQTEVPQLVAGNNYIITVGINQSNIATNNNFLKTIVSLEHSLPPSPLEDPEEDNLWINLSNTVQVYDGTAKSIEAVLMNGNSESDLVLGVDYTLTAQYYSNGNLIDPSLITNSGTYSVVVTVKLFELDEDSEPILDEDLNPIVASTLTVNTTLIIQKSYLTVDTGDTSKVYDNTAINKADFEADITVEALDASGQLQTLTLLTDYEVTILNGNQEIQSILNAGFYTIMLTPIGDYESNYESFTFKFTISQAAINFTLDAPQINGSVYDGSNKTISVNWSEFEAAYGVNTPKPTLTWSPNAALISPSSTGASVKNAGIYSITATISNNINFIGTASVQFEILKRQLTLTQKVFEEYWLPDTQWTTLLEDAFVISGKAIGDTIVINAENFSLSVGNGTWNNPINAQTYTITLSCINPNYTGAITFNFKIKKSTLSIKYQSGNNALIIVGSAFKSDGYTSNGNYDFFEFDKLRYVYNGDTSPEAVKAVIDNLSPLNISTSNSLFEYTEEKDININNSGGASIVSPNHRIKGFVSMDIIISLNNNAKGNIEFESETKTDVIYEIIVWE